MNALANPLLDQLLNSVGDCLNPEAASRIVALRAESRLQARIDDLASRNTEGQLSPDEFAEYEAYVWAGNLIAVLQSKARALLRKHANE